jgi:hypothetical protein
VHVWDPLLQRSATTNAMVQWLSVAVSQPQPRYDLVASCIDRTSRKIIVGAHWFHSQSHMFPKGFKSTRIYWSRLNPLARVVYVIEVVECDRRVAQECAELHDRTTAHLHPELTTDAWSQICSDGDRNIANRTKRWLDHYERYYNGWCRVARGAQLVAVFRVTSMDDVENPIIGFSLQQVQCGDGLLPPSC